MENPPDHDKSKHNETGRTFKSLKEFYPFYLSEHSNRTSRRLHLLGSNLALIFVAIALFNWQWKFLLIGVVTGYAFAWAGHFFFEHNRPATFKYPLYSFCCDWIMYKDIVTGKIPF